MTLAKHDRIVLNCCITATGADAGDKAKAEKEVVVSVCPLWRTVDPDRMDNATVMGDMNKNRLVDQARVLERAVNILVTHMRYSKPNSDPLLMKLEAKDWLLAKEWGYVNADSVLDKTGLAALDVVKRSESCRYIGRCLALANTSFKATLELLLMRGQYFQDIVEHGWRTQGRRRSWSNRGKMQCTLLRIVCLARLSLQNGKLRLRSSFLRPCWREQSTNEVKAGPRMMAPPARNDL